MPHPFEITPQEVAAKRSAKRPMYLIDCRTPEERELVKLQDDLFVPVDDLDLHMDELRGRIDLPIVIYCHTGRRSLTMTTFLRTQGFPDVKSMAGGIERWAREVDPTVPRYTKDDGIPALLDQ